MWVQPTLFAAIAIAVVDGMTIAEHPRYRACLLAVSHCSTLDLRKLELTGEIPESIGTLTNLKSIYLYENQLTGSIPYSIGNLLKLESLWLYDNKLTGALPHSIGKLVSLKKLSIKYNMLSGVVPHSIGHLLQLEYLNLHCNQFTGLVPQELGDLRGTLTTLYLSKNRFDGGGVARAPSQLAHLKTEYNLENKYVAERWARAKKLQHRKSDYGNQSNGGSPYIPLPSVCADT